MDHKCSKCNELKPAEAFYIQRIRGHYKLQSCCKACARINQREWYQRKRAKMIQDGIEPRLRGRPATGRKGYVPVYFREGYVPRETVRQREEADGFKKCAWCGIRPLTEFRKQSRNIVTGSAYKVRCRVCENIYARGIRKPEIVADVQAKTISIYKEGKLLLARPLFVAQQEDNVETTN